MQASAKSLHLFHGLCKKAGPCHKGLHMIKTNNQIITQTTEAKSPQTAFQKQAAGMSQSRRSVDHISSLHHCIGNQAVQRLYEAGMIQAKLTIGRPDDVYEQEADKTAETIMAMPDISAGQTSDVSAVQRKAGCPFAKCSSCQDEEPLQTKALTIQSMSLLQKNGEEEENVQRQPEEEEEKLQRKPEEEEEKLQAKGESDVARSAPDFVENHMHASGGGRVLPEGARSFFEPRFGYDFSGVRIHADSSAELSAKSINAQAFTHGRDIYFGASRYNPDTSSGKSLLAHELTHVVQQNHDTIKRKR
jgi:hypothetical protein